MDKSNDTGLLQIVKYKESQLMLNTRTKKAVRKRGNASNDYVNNEKFYLEMVRYKNAIEEAKKQNKPKPRASDYIGQCIMLIANKVSNSPNFMHYSYKDEMISDGVENCMLYLDNFDPEKSRKPFAYFTQIIWFAFVRRIQKEKRQQYIKAKNLQLLSIADSLNDVMSIERMAPNDAMNDLIAQVEGKSLKKKEKKKTGLEVFVDESE
jgi:hypothetical protein